MGKGARFVVVFGCETEDIPKFDDEDMDIYEFHDLLDINDTQTENGYIISLHQSRYGLVIGYTLVQHCEYDGLWVMDAYELL